MNKTDKKVRSLKRANLKAEHQAEFYKKTRSAHESETAEDYVEVISDLISTKGQAKTVDIAKIFGVTHVTVNKTINRLQRDGFVISEPYKSIFLTEKGRSLAEKCRERHEIVLDFLRSLGVSEKTALVDSEGIEHHVSDETLRALKKLTKQLSGKVPGTF